MHQQSEYVIWCEIFSCILYGVTAEYNRYILSSMLCAVLFLVWIELNCNWSKASEQKMMEQKQMTMAKKEKKQQQQQILTQMPSTIIHIIIAIARFSISSLRLLTTIVDGWFGVAGSGLTLCLHAYAFMYEYNISHCPLPPHIR